MTDRFAAQAAQKVVTDLVNDGGGTYEHGTMLPFKPRDGFAVGVGGIHMPAADFTVDQVLFFASRVAGEFETSFFGTWLDDGIVYLDAVRYFAEDNAQGAFSAAVAHDQQAVWSFRLARSLRPGQLSFDQ